MTETPVACRAPLAVSGAAGPGVGGEGREGGAPGSGARFYPHQIANIASAGGTDSTRGIAVGDDATIVADQPADVDRCATSRSGHIADGIAVADAASIGPD